MENKIAETAGLTVVFSSKKGKPHIAVNGVSLSLMSGDTLAVVGESGSGKTTLLRSLMRLVKPERGKAALFGKDLSQVRPEGLARIRQKCGYVQQDPYGAIPPGLSALEAVVEPALIARTGGDKHEIRNKAERLLNEFGLKGERILRSRAVSLSGGQRQRVQIARALMLSPKLLLCDEPTSMQDVSTRGEVIDVLLRHISAGAAMIFVTHDLILAGRGASRIMVMKDGTVCEEGRADKILDSPEHPYTKKLIASIPSSIRSG